jgi:hypothetical protein
VGNTEVSRYVDEQARLKAIGRVAAALSSPDPERPGVVAWVAHSGLSRVAELATDAALEAVAGDIAAAAVAQERERRKIRDKQGRELHCPECGQPSVEGYPTEVMSGDLSMREWREAQQ